MSAKCFDVLLSTCAIVWLLDVRRCGKATTQRMFRRDPQERERHTTKITVLKHNVEEVALERVLWDDETTKVDRIIDPYDMKGLMD